jgi:hypothetical protein
MAIRGDGSMAAEVGRLYIARPIGCGETGPHGKRACECVVEAAWSAYWLEPELFTRGHGRGESGPGNRLQTFGAPTSSAAR